LKERIVISSEEQVLKKKKQIPTKRKVRKHFSEVLVLTCGDYRVAPFVRKYLKRMQELWEMDILTTAGGSRVISFYEVNETDELYDRMKIKEQALWIDFTIYLTHNARVCVLADHNACGMWPKFATEEEEDKAHIASLMKSREIILKKYPSLKRVVLLYVIIHPITHIPIKMKIIDAIGRIRTIVIKKVKKLSLKNPPRKLSKKTTKKQ